MKKVPIETEATDRGDQTLVPGVRPIMPAGPSAGARGRTPAPKHKQKHRNLGLFDEDARNQLDPSAPPGSRPVAVASLGQSNPARDLNLPLLEQ